MILSIHPSIEPSIVKATINADADFFLTISAPSTMEYWETINLTITIEELANSTQNNISAEIVLESGLYLAEGEIDTHNIGNLNPYEEKSTNFSITASTTFLTNPIVIYKIYLYKDGVQQYVNTMIEGDVYLLNYGVGSITIQFPILAVTSIPLELTGFVVPRLSLLHDEKQTLTYNISNKGVANLKNLTFQVKFDNKIIEIISTTLRGEFDGEPFENVSTTATIPSLDTLPGNSFVLFIIYIRCISFVATDNSRVYLNVSSDFFSTREYSVKIQTYDIYNPYKYDNALVLITWPIYILFFVVLALAILWYSRKKQNRRKKKAQELIKAYGDSYVD